MANWIKVSQVSKLTRLFFPISQRLLYLLIIYSKWLPQETLDCKDIDNYQCSSLDQLFEVADDYQEDRAVKDYQRNDSDEILDFVSYDFPNYQCNNGKCHNITGVYSCRINETNIMNQVLFIIVQE